MNRVTAASTPDKTLDLNPYAIICGFNACLAVFLDQTVQVAAANVPVNEQSEAAITGRATLTMRGWILLRAT